MNYKKKKKKKSCSVGADCRPKKQKRYQKPPSLKVLKDIEIQKEIPGGKGLGFHNDKPVFVDRVLEGEIVDVALNRANSKGYFGYPQEVVKASPKRITPACEHYEQCGGCNLQHMSYADQVVLKEKYLLDQFKRIAKQELVSIDVVASPEWRYRTRARVQMRNKSWGFLARESHDIVEVSKCLVLSQEIEDALNGEVELSKGQLHIQQGDSDLAWGDQETSVTIEQKSFPVRAGAFFQSNQIILGEMIREVIRGKGDYYSLAMDLFAGIGFFSAFLSDHFKNVVAVERDVKCKNIALDYLPNNVEYFCDSVEAYIEKTSSQRPDFLVVDPPRLGLSKEVKDFLIELKSPRVCYVSCEASTLARDIKDLVEGGYKLESVKGFDLYPQTSHIETVVHLVLI